MISEGWPHVRQYVDLKDRDGSWLAGLVMNNTETLIRVHCEGWSARYDENIPASQDNILKHPKIRPFRTHTRGYTGQRKTVACRQYWKFTNQDHEGRLKRLDSYIANLQELAVVDLWQFLRGEHYYYIDFLMSSVYHQQEDITKVYQYFECHIRLCKLYLQKMLEQGIEKWLSKQATTENSQEGWRWAYSQCYFQLFDALYSIAGLNERLACFTRLNQKHIKQIIGIYETHENYVSNELLEIGTFDLIKKTINSAYQIVSDGSGEIPFLFGYTLVQMFMIIERTLHLQKDAQMESLLDKLFVVISKVLDEIQPEELKGNIIDRQIEYILANFKAIYAKHSKKDAVADWVEEFRVKYYVFIIKSNSLDRKLKGINKLKEYSEDLGHCPPGKETKMTKEKFKHLFTELKCEEVLFENEHPEIFKKSIELICHLYRAGMASIDSLIFTWDKSINKEPAVVKYLHAYWNQVALRVPPEDNKQFIDVVYNFYTPESAVKDSNESVQFLFKFVQSLIKNHNYLKYRPEPASNINEIEENITKLISQLEQVLLSKLDRENQELLIQYYSRIVLWSSHAKEFILKLFSYLSNHIYYRISISILSQIYTHVESYNFFLPDNFSVILLNCLKMWQLELKETYMLMMLLNRILQISRELSKGFQMKKEDFKQYWDYFQSTTQVKREVFYEWISMQRKVDYDDQSLRKQHIFSPQLKSYIIMEILCEQSFANFIQLTKKELDIILQFFIQKNLAEQKLQQKNYLSDYKSVYRLKSFELIKQDFLWQIFEKCKNFEVINLLNKNLIAFYCYYSPTVPYNLKKGRIDQFLIKLKTYLDTGFKNTNNGLIKNTLMLLKNVIELIREDKKNEVQNNLSYTKVQIFYDGKTYHLESKYQDTVANIKLKIANSFKIKLSSFKLVNNKQEEMGFDSKDVPICCFSEKYFKIVEVPEEEETLTKFIHTFLDEEIEEVLFKMLESEQTALQVYEVLDELEFKQEKRFLFKRITEVLDKYNDKQQASLAFIHCFYLLQIKLINRHIDDTQFIHQCFSYPNVSRFLKMMTHPIRLHVQINLLHMITFLFIKMNRKGGEFLHKMETSQKCLGLIYEIYRFAEEHKMEANIKQAFCKINHNCFYLLQDINQQNQMFVLLFSTHIIEPILQCIFFSRNFQEVKLFFLDKLKKYIAFYQLEKKRNEEVEKKLVGLFINKFYSKIAQMYANKEIKHEDKGQVEFFQILCKVIETTSSENTQITIQQNTISLFEKTKLFLINAVTAKQPRQFQSIRFIIVGHLNILRAIIQSYPRLKSISIINFILTECLGASKNVDKAPLCRSPAQIQAAFEIIRTHLSYHNPTSFIKCIMDILDPCQKIILWRTSNKWSVNVSPQGKQQYSGLNNPGCICYMNSLLQQLFMIDQFRNGIFAIKSEKMSEQEKKTNGTEKKTVTHERILESLKKLFLNLRFSEENTINPVPFAMTIRTAQRRPMIKITQQMDIDEFESILFDKLQKQLQHLKNRNIIRELFGGVYLNQIVSTQCSHKSEREESFISISLEVKKNIYQSFRSFVKVDYLDGDNKYYCQTCNKKVKAEKVQSIKKLPPYLILCLKRFQFNFEVETKIKINDFCQFYQKIKLREFSTQELNRCSMVDEQNETKEATLPDDYFNYKLRGVVVHTGSADSGHYYSFIQNNEGNWFQFNDQEVFPFDISKLPDEAFGSKGHFDDSRIRNAYLLIYERQAKESPSQMQTEENIFQMEENRQLIDEILIRNQQVYKFELMFSQSYSRLVEMMRISFEGLDISQAATISDQWQQFFMSYYLLIHIRRQNFERFLEISEEIQKEIQRNQNMCQKYLKLFTSCSFLQEFFIYNPMRQRSRVLSHLLFTALVRYISTGIDIVGNELINMILLAIKVMLINYGQINQLEITLRKLLEYLSNNDIEALHYIIKSYSFENVIMDQVFGNVITFQQKEEFGQILAKNKKSIGFAFMPPIDISDKRQNNDENIETWRIIAISLRQYTKMTNLAAQQQDFLKNNQQLLVSTITKVTINKIMGAIYDSHQQSNVDYLYLAFKELNLLPRLRQAMEKGLKDYQSSKYRPFMLLVLAYISDPSATEEEIEAIVTILENAYRHNDKYFLQVDLFNQWILKLVVNSERFFRKFQQRKSFTDMITAWMAKTPNPSSDHLKKHKVPSNERLLNRYYGIVVSSEVKDYEHNNMLMKFQYQSVINSLKPPKAQSLVRVQQPFTPQKPIRYYDPTELKWNQGTVLQNQFGYLTIRVGYKDSKRINLWEDSERIRVSNMEDFGEEKEEDSDYSYEDSEQSGRF